jgi:hypothetical protein
VVAHCPGWLFPLALPIPSGSDFDPTYDISYGGLKLPRVSAGFRRSYLRRDTDLPKEGRARSRELLDMALSLGTDS